MSGDIHDIVDPRHDMKIAVLVEEARIAGQIVAGEPFEIGLPVALRSVPQRRREAGRQGQACNDCAAFAGRDGFALFVDTGEVPAGHR